MKSGPARLLFPALRWSAERGFDDHASVIELGLRQGVGGFIVFGGGDTDAVGQLTDKTQSRCDYALLFGSDLERGAGQQFDGAAQLPPLAAVGSLDDIAITARAAEMTAREARALGINWVFAPVADLDVEPRNPIVGTRSFGADSAFVARHVDSWIRGCHRGGALACSKHFPGHGRTTEDSHATLPHVTATRAQLDNDLEPFRAAIAANVDAIMTAHVVFDDLDADFPATLSTHIINGILRSELRFEGLVVTDGMGMQGILDACDGSEIGAGIAAVNAGCDVLLYPTDPASLVDALNAELGRSLSARRVTEAVERIAATAQRAIGATGKCGLVEDAEWALSVGVNTVHALGDRVDLPRAFDVVSIDDDLGGPHPAPSRETFLTALRDYGFDPRPADVANAEHAVVVAVYADIRAWKGAPGITANAQRRIADAVTTRSDAVVVLFSHPRVADTIDARCIVIAWGGEAIMQRAAARWLADSSGR